MSKIKTTNITRFGIEVSPIFRLYPFPDVAALMDLLYISRSSAVHPLTRFNKASPHPVLHILLSRSFWLSFVSLAFHFYF